MNFYLKKKLQICALKKCLLPLEKSNYGNPLNLFHQKISEFLQSRPLNVFKWFNNKSIPPSHT